MSLSPFNFSFSRSNILGSLTPGVEEHFVLGECLGKGHFGVVRACLDRKTGERLACKSICKSKLKCWEEREDVRREVDIMGLLGKHPSIVSLRGAFEDSSDVHLVMDCCEGGELFDEISSRGPLSEAHAAQVLHGVAQALVHCHQQGVLHRDLKPENILLVSKAERQKKLSVKLADFGLSVKLKDGEVISGLAGSPYYLAPEVLVGKYGHMADIWSLGVVVYMMLSETAPFYGETEKEILESIKQADLKFSSSNWEKVSEEAKDLVRKMLQRDPNVRPSAKEVLEHPWLRKHVLDAVDTSVQPLNIPRSCSSTPPPRSGAGQCCNQATSTDVLGVHQCQSLPRVNSATAKASELLTWLSPQLVGVAGEHTAVRGSGLDGSSGLLHKFNEVMSELEDGIHYFVLDEGAGCDNGSTDLRLQLAEIQEVDCKPTCRQIDMQVPATSVYEPTPIDVLDWIFGL